MLSRNAPMRTARSMFSSTRSTARSVNEISIWRSGCLRASEQHRRDAMVAERERHADPQAAARLAVSALEFHLGGFQFGQRPDASIVIGLPGLRQCLAARRALEQAHAKATLEPRNHLADGRARQPHALGCKRKAAGFDDLHKDRHAIQFVHHIGVSWE